MNENIEEQKVTEPEQDSELPELNDEISVTDAMIGVITEPADTFDAVKRAKKNTFWILPLVLVTILTILASVLVVNDEELYSEIKTMQTDAVRKKFDQMVENGQMTREQANEQLDKTSKMFDKSNPFFWVTSLVGPIFGVVIAFFIRGLAFWGGVRLFGGTAFYTKILSVLGLAVMIDIVQTVVNTVLAIIMGRIMVNIGPTLFLTTEMVGDKMLKFLSHIDLFNFWWIFVVGIGVAIVSNISKVKGLILVGGLWLLWAILSSFVGTMFMG